MEGDGLIGVGLKVLFNLSKEKFGAPVLTAYKGPAGQTLGLTGAGFFLFLENSFLIKFKATSTIWISKKTKPTLA